MTPGFFQSWYLFKSNLFPFSFSDIFIYSFLLGIQYEFQSIRCEPIVYHNPNHRHQHRHQSLIHWIKFRLRGNRSRLLLITCVTIIILLLMYIGGIFVHPFETIFDGENFHYPLYMKDFRYFIENVKQNSANNALKPIHNYSYDYHLNPKFKCQQNFDNMGTNSTSSLYSNNPITLLLVIKSATCNFLLRNIIRQTWGNEQRFSDVQIRTVFMLGKCSSSVNQFRCPNTFHHYPNIVFTKKSQKFRSIFAFNQTVDCQKLIDIENQFYNDLVQADFIDSYYNNTKKTMASLQWTAQNCHQVPFILFVDDDYYISIKNLLKFTRNYLRLIIQPNSSMQPSNDYDSGLNDNQDLWQDNDWFYKQQQQQPHQFDGRLYVGYVFANSHPQRHLTSKWYISLDEYQWNRYPPYVTGGCFLVNNQTVIDLYYASLYSQPFKYDDVYLGILAYRMRINLIDNKQQMYFYPLEYDGKKYSTIIGSHGFHDPKFLWQVWNEQKSFGNA